MIKRWVGIVLLCSLFFGCAEKKPEVFDKAELKTLSESLVQEVLVGNVPAVYDRVIKEYRDLTPLEAFEAHATDQLAKAGAFDSVVATQVDLGEEPLTKAPQAQVVVVTRCANGTLKYNFVFNEALEIRGFLMDFQLR